MSNRRAPESDQPDLKEDRGLYKGGVVVVALELTPLCKNTNRGDLLFVGYIDGVEIEVVFPGRRRSVTRPLLADIERHVAHVQKTAMQKGRPGADVAGIRYSLRAEGTWRARLLGDDDELERRYQFLVARWSITGADGQEKQYGDLPVN